MATNLKDILAVLPERVAASYDGLRVSPDHYKRMQKAYLDDSPTPMQTMGHTYAGIRVVPNPSVPEGFAVAMSGDKPVGVIDFAKGTATLVRNQRD